MPDVIDLRIGPALVLSDPRRAPEMGYVEVLGTRIHHVGPQPSSDVPALEQLSAPGRMIIPAFVNTHCHTSQQLGRGLADDVDLLTWLHERIWPYEIALTESDCEISAALCALEQIRNGTTTIADPGGRHVDGMARGLTTAGIRAFLGRSSMDIGDGRPPGDTDDLERVLATQDELFDRWHGRGRLRFSYTLRTIFNCSDELIVATCERAAERDTFVQMHMSEVPEENAFALANRGATTIRHLGRLGVLGPRFVGVHATWADDEEIALVAATGTHLSHNAGSNLKILGQPRVAEWLAAGVNVALGTDGAPSNNRMSMIDEMWLASLAQKGRTLDPTVLPAPEVLAMATCNGAAAVGMGAELGRLAPGFWADLVVVDPRTVSMVPLHDAHAALVTSMRADNIESVMCEGQWLMRDRRVLTLDEDALLDEAMARAAAIARRLGR
jgi:5-methylthioadenosine/S-adenosylhomocysteine deaminase